MEDDVVLADEMHHLGVGALPVFFPVIGTGLDGVGDVADGGVEPHVEDLALGALYGHGNTPVEVTAHGPGLETAVDPGLALAVDIGFPLLVLLEDPLAEPGLILVQRQVPVFGTALHGRLAAQGGMRIDQLVRAEGAAALLALVLRVQPHFSHWSP